MKVTNFKSKKLTQKKTTDNLKIKNLKNELRVKKDEKYNKEKKKKINKHKKKDLILSKHEDALNNKKREKKVKREMKNLISTKNMKGKRISKKDKKKTNKLKIDTNGNESEDLEDEELCDDDNLFMPSVLKSKKGKSVIDKTSKQQKRKKRKKKQCATECLKLSEYNEEYEKDLLSYAMNGFYKYLNFLKNYKNTVESENPIDNKKPKHLYV